jgi:hypothetical protein
MHEHVIAQPWFFDQRNIDFAHGAPDGNRRSGVVQFHDLRWYG